jgi:hypothetical protein
MQAAVGAAEKVAVFRAETVTVKELASLAPQKLLAVTDKLPS